MLTPPQNDGGSLSASAALLERAEAMFVETKMMKAQVGGVRSARAAPRVDMEKKIAVVSMIGKKRMSKAERKKQKKAQQKAAGGGE